MALEQHPFFKLIEHLELFNLGLLCGVQFLIVNGVHSVALSDHSLTFIFQACLHPCDLRLGVWAFMDTFQLTASFFKIFKHFLTKNVLRIHHLVVQNGFERTGLEELVDPLYDSC